VTAWKQLELRIARMWGGTRTGPVGRDGPDVAGVPLAIQIKRTGNTTGGIKGAWIKQACRDGAKAKLPWVLVVAGHNDRRPVAIVDHAWLVEVYMTAREQPGADLRFIGMDDL
jgi:hypothetical protein